jgi:hypothetical protein
MTIITCGECKSQFNDTINYYLHYGATGIYNQTNDANTYVFNNALKFSISKKSVLLNASGSWIYGWQEDKIVNNDVTSALDFNLYKTLPHFNYWGLANFDKSYSLKINKRLQAGLGGAYDLVHSPNARVNISDGILYEHSDLQLADGSNDVYGTFRNSLRLKYNFTIYKIFVLDGTHFLQNSLSYKQDYIIRSVSDFSVRLREWLRFTTSVSYNKVTRVNRKNLLVTFGVSVDKYF